MFQVFFAGDGVVDVLEALEVDEAMGFVFCGEAVGRSFTIFANAAQEAVGDAYVEVRERLERM